MKTRAAFFSGYSFALLLLWAGAWGFAAERARAGDAVPREFMGRGVVREVDAVSRSIVIRHEAMPGYMAAMTMPFHVREAAELAGLARGDEITFRLLVTDSESRVDRLVKTGTPSRPGGADAEKPAARTLPAAELSGHPLLDRPFTNELGRAVTLRSFRGTALAVTFFYTRCPIPEFCPRLSKNFQQASEKLRAMGNAPTNWHFLSFSFDTEHDSPGILREYGERYQYDPAHWSFLSGDPDSIAELARQSQVEYRLEDGTFSHNFRTLIIDANGDLRMVYPVTGDISDSIVQEIIKAAGVTNAAR